MERPCVKTRCHVTKRSGLCFPEKLTLSGPNWSPVNTTWIFSEDTHPSDLTTFHQALEQID